MQRFFKNRCKSFSCSCRTGVTQVHCRLIRRYFHGIRFPHQFSFVFLLYHNKAAIDEEFLNEPKRKYYQKANATNGSICRICYIGYWLLNRRSNGRINVKMLTAQGYSAFRDANIRTMQDAVTTKGPITASSLAMVIPNSPLDRRLIPTCSGRCFILYAASFSA